MTLGVPEVPEKILNNDQCKINNCSEEKETKTERFKEYIREICKNKSKITVEPFVFCYIMPSVLAGLAVQNLCLEKSCVVNLSYNASTCSSIMSSTSNKSEAEQNVQKTVALMTSWSYPMQTSLPGILTLFLGSWSDRTGNRKIFMVLPIIGKIVSTIGLILSTIFFTQVDMNATTVIEGLPPALTGGKVAMTMAVYSYISDITTESERSFRLGIITAILTLSRPIGLALSGYMTHTFGYYVIFSISCVFYIFGFVYITLRVKTKKKKTVDNEKPGCVSLFCLSDFVATVNVALRSRKDTRRLQIFLIMFAYMFVSGPVIVESQITYLFTRYKFNFNEVDYSLFLTYSVILGSIGSFVSIYIFTKKWQMEDSLLGIIACVSRVAASVVYALAPTSTIYFLGPLLDMFSYAGTTALRSMATKLVEDDEMGKMSSLISIAEALVPVIYSPLYNKVYDKFLGKFPGAFYLLSTLLATFAIFINIVLYWLPKRKVKEAKPKDNDEVTNF